MSEAASAEPLPLPPNALVGEEAVAMVAEEVSALVRSQHDPAVIDRAVAMARRLLEAGTSGEPILRFDRTIEGGYLRTPVHLRPNRHVQVYWEMVAVVDGTGHTSGVQHPELRLSVDSLFRAARKLDPSLLVIGREAIRHRLATRWLGILALNPREDAYRVDGNFLTQLAGTKLPFAEFYPMNPDDYSRLVDLLRRRVLAAPNTNEQAAVLDALVYCQGLDGEGRRELLQALGEELTRMLPVRPGEDSADPIVAAKLLSVGYEPSPNLLQGVGATPQIRHAAFLSKLYADLSNILDDGQSYTPIEIPPVEVSEPPEPRDLAIFGGPIPQKEDILADITYLRELHAAGSALDLTRDYSETTVKIGVARIMQHILASNDARERATAFKALECLYNLQRDIQRDYLYELLTLRLARTVPLEDRATSLRGYIGAAQTMGDITPTPPSNDRGEPLPQPARTAAMLSRIYHGRARQMVLRMIRAYFPEDESNSPSEVA